jgi:hypothetical protein
MSGRGLPSWYKYRAYGPVYEEIRLAEHAVRLGSPVSFDRRGDVIWFDDFEQGLGKWSEAGLGTGYSITPSVSYARSGGLSAHLVAGSTSSRYASIAHLSPYSSQTKLGFEIAWTYGANWERLNILIDVYDGSYHYIGEIEYQAANRRWVYYDSAYTAQPFLTEFEPYINSYLFNVAKLVIDLAAVKYARALINSQGVALPYSCYRSVDTSTVPQVQVSLTLKSLAGYNAESYVDDAIITQNEP